jgi:hypothetical protein
VSWNGTAPASPKPLPSAPSKQPRTSGGDIPMWLILVLAAIFITLLVVVVASAQ